MAEHRGHAFLCYVRENAVEVDALSASLIEAGIPVWRDTAELWPGQDWKDKIREAITEGAFAFLGCFSTVSVAREVSGQYPELYLAAEEHRRRRPGIPWIFPVRFDDCAVPNVDLGGGKTLGDIHRADLFGPSHERDLQRLIGAVSTILQSTHPPEPEPTTRSETDAADASSLIEEASPSVQLSSTSLSQRLKKALRDDRSDIIVHDLVVPIADRVREQLNDTEAFPINGPADVAQIVDMVHRQWVLLDELLEVLVIAGLWGSGEHEPTWTEAAQRVASTASEHWGGLVRLLQARGFPLLPMVYATGIASVYRNNYGPLRAVAIDATVKDHRGRVAVVTRSSPWYPFSEYTLPAQVLAFDASGEVVDENLIMALQSRQRGNRYTPGSDLLHDRLRPRFANVIIDDDQYGDTFDRLEVLLGLLVADERIRMRENGPWIPNPTTGRFTWRERYSEAGQTVDRRMLADLIEKGDAWPPLRSGMFGGSVARANSAFDLFLPLADEARASRW